MSVLVAGRRDRSPRGRRGRRDAAGTYRWALGRPPLPMTSRIHDDSGMRQRWLPIASLYEPSCRSSLYHPIDESLIRMVKVLFVLSAFEIVDCRLSSVDGRSNKPIKRNCLGVPTLFPLPRGVVAWPMWVVKLIEPADRNGRVTTPPRLARLA